MMKRWVEGCYLYPRGAQERQQLLIARRVVPASEITSGCDSLINFVLPICWESGSKIDFSLFVIKNLFARNYCCIELAINIFKFSQINLSRGYLRQKIVHQRENS